MWYCWHGGVGSPDSFPPNVASHTSFGGNVEELLEWGIMGAYKNRKGEREVKRRSIGFRNENKVAI